ncbi:MAG: hypothetical protein ACRD1Y_03230 [Terriglobales bacterium]
MTQASSSRRWSAWLVLALLVGSLLAFAYSLHVRKRDWPLARRPAVLTQLIPPRSLPL